MRRHIIQLAPQILGDQYQLPVMVDIEAYHRMMAQPILHNADKYKVSYCERPSDEK